MTTNFVDTNVLVYLVSDEAMKARRAEQLLAEKPTVSVQILNELARVARRKLRFDWEEVDELLKRLRHRLDVIPLTVAAHERGIELAARYQLSVFDGQIVASALLAGCGTLWSEDMHDGLVVESRLTIRNPFAAAASL